MVDPNVGPFETQILQKVVQLYCHQQCLQFASRKTGETDQEVVDRIVKPTSVVVCIDLHDHCTNFTQKCTACREPRAFVGCAVYSCPNVYHFGYVA